MLGSRSEAKTVRCQPEGLGLKASPVNWPLRNGGSRTTPVVLIPPD